MSDQDKTVENETDQNNTSEPSRTAEETATQSLHHVDTVSGQEDSEASANLSANEVAAFLKNNPNFFRTHSELLSELNFNHETGGAVSLIQRQVELLREHHQTTRKRLADLNNIAKTNEALLGRIRTLSVAVAAAETPKKILDTLTRVIINDFGLDSVYLAVEHKNWPMYSDNVVGLTPEELGNLRNAVYNLNVFVGRPSEKLRQIALKNKEDKTASIAMTRFKYKDVDTYLVIGSSDKNHFTNDMGTDFVSYIGEFLQALLNR